ncbi:MAG: cation-translocating P-type ATPase [Oscillospiraceae bacterium]|nr:cation-translocating P-type ATPase [Oscillospiraceae bacterium]
MLNNKYNYKDNIQIGLTTGEAKERISRFGENILSEKKKNKPLVIFLGQFKDIMTVILLISTVISVFLKEYTDAVTIILIVLLNSILGFIQEYRAEKTLESLKELTSPTAKCWRDAILRVIPARELVPDDVIELEAGDKVPADAVILSCSSFYADESILTGESVPMEKSVCKGNILNNDIGQAGVVYSGTIITRGNARARVLATGLSSQAGKISDMISEAVESETPLQIRLGKLGKVLAIICLVICIIVTLAGVLKGEEVFTMLLTGISIAVAAIPEGLPAAVTIALALAVNRMMKQKALVKRLHSVETLGCVSVICSDKTGTITENKMTVSKIYTNSNILDIYGKGYKIKGEIQLNGRGINPKSSPALTGILNCAVLCSNAEISSENEISQRERGKISAFGEWKVNGDPTEIALLIASAKGNITKEKLSDEFTRVSEIPFESETRMMTVFAKARNGETKAFIKGATDTILPKCSYYLTDSGKVPLTNDIRKEIMSVCDDFSDNALRVIAFAEKICDKESETESGLVFSGLMGMSDAPRDEAKKAIKLCRKAGIKTVMITGDHPKTALAIAKQAGITGFMKSSQVLTGEDLMKMSDNELYSKIQDVSVFARVSPADKLKIVKAFKKRGHIVAMTGDGVNDAPAIKEADIGISMGDGTDTAKEASDVILIDNNFAVIVGAVKNGRAIYMNIRKFVRYLLSCNIGEVITMFLGILSGLPLVLLPTQILLVNLVTDSLPAIALGLEPADDDVMTEKPRSKDESFFSDGLMSKIFIRGIFIGLSTLSCFAFFLKSGAGIEIARTSALVTLVMSQLIHVFECKSEKKNIFTINLMNNKKLIFAVIISAIALFASMYIPFLSSVFTNVPLTMRELVISLGFSLFVPVVSGLFSMILGIGKKD